MKILCITNVVTPAFIVIIVLNMYYVVKSHSTKCCTVESDVKIYIADVFNVAIYPIIAMLYITIITSHDQLYCVLL